MYLYPEYASVIKNKVLVYRKNYSQTPGLWNGGRNGEKNLRYFEIFWVLNDRIICTPSHPTPIFPWVQCMFSPTPHVMWIKNVMHLQHVACEVKKRSYSQSCQVKPRKTNYTNTPHGHQGKIHVHTTYTIIDSRWRNIQRSKSSICTMIFSIRACWCPWKR